jgi:hypothetical protein
MKTNKLAHLSIFIVLFLSMSLAWGYPSEVGNCSIKITYKKTELPISFTWEVNNGEFSITSIVGETEFNEISAGLDAENRMLDIYGYLHGGPFDKDKVKDKNKIYMLKIERVTHPALTPLDNRKYEHIFARVFKIYKQRPQEAYPSNSFEVKGDSCIIESRNPNVYPTNGNGVLSIETLKVRNSKL